MRSKPRTEAEKAWHETVARFASETNWLETIYGPEFAGGGFHLDHFLGAQAKRKINLVSEKVGEKATVPVPIALHDVHSSHPLNVTHHKKAHEAKYGKQSDTFGLMTNVMRAESYEVPISQDVIDAIMRG